MRRKTELPELLAPAGDFDCLIAAVKGGADAVYVGGKKFGARAYAKNFDLDEMEKAVNYCHLHGVKLYVTLNILLEDEEVEEAQKFASSLYEIGVDALIVADLGLISALRKYVPKLELHASTQMSVHNTNGANFAHSIGMERVVLARELSKENIRSVTENSKPEIEVFLHGALCVCHSGQCLFSSMVGGRSGNRGECAQPCRLPYNNKYPLSLCDLSLANHIKELIEIGVSSLKIEGRMKSPDYVFTVTSIYRKLLDQNRNSNREEDEALKRIFSRGGFTDAYFKGQPLLSMTGVRSSHDKQNTKEDEVGSFEIEKIDVCAKVEIRLHERMKMTLIGEVGGRNSKQMREVTVFGECPDVAKNAPLTPDGVKDRLCKMGNTFLNLSKENIDLTLDENINISPSLINALRREATLKFESERREKLDSSVVSPTPCHKNTSGKLKKSALFIDPEVLNKVSKNVKLREIFEVVFAPLWRIYEVECEINGVALPPVITDGEMEEVKEMLKVATERGVRFALVGNIGQIELVKEFSLVPVGDFRLNVTNSYTREFFDRYNFDFLIVSPELTLPKVRSIGGCEIVYGRIPLMLTERCFIKENFGGCEKCSKVSFTDRKGVKFPIMREYKHRNLILNSAVTYYLDKLSELSKYNVKNAHFIFTKESAEEVRQVINASVSGGACQKNVSFRRIGKRENIKK